MEDTEKVLGLKGSTSNVSEKSTRSLTPSNFAKQELLKPEPVQAGISNDAEKIAEPIESSKDPEGDQKSQDAPVQKEELDEHKYVRETLKLINRIALEAEMFRQQIENFSGSSTDDKDFVYLEEMLIRATVALDNIDTRGNVYVRQERKRAVQYVQKLMRLLDARLKDNKQNIRYYSTRESSDDSDEDI